MNVHEIMTRPVVTVRRDANLEEAARLLLQRQIGCLPVVDDAGRLCGIITVSDFAARERGVPFSTLLLPRVLDEWLPREGVERIYAAARSTPVSELMTPDPVHVPEGTPVEEVMRLMLHLDIHHVPVVRSGLPVGIVARHDLLRMMVEAADRAGAEVGT